jgi:hypothetical protein
VESQLTSALLLNFGLLVFPSVSEEGITSGQNPSVTGLRFQLGGYKYLSRELALKMILDFKSYSADFSGGASISQKSFSVVPSLQYYF